MAEMMGVSVKTLQRWRLFGDGPEWKKFGSAVRYPSVALQNWIENAPSGGGEFAHLIWPTLIV
ncbi:MAG: helix-turn-helix domain-containing protein [Candidatus Solibacter sp.]